MKLLKLVSVANIGSSIFTQTNLYYIMQICV